MKGAWSQHVFVANVVPRRSRLFQLRALHACLCHHPIAHRDSSRLLQTDNVLLGNCRAGDLGHWPLLMEYTPGAHERAAAAGVPGALDRYGEFAAMLRSLQVAPSHTEHI